MADHYSGAVNVLLHVMLTVLRVPSLMPLHGDAQTAVLVGGHCMVKLFGPKLAHIGNLMQFC